MNAADVFPPLKEKDVLREISEYLKWKRYFFWRQNTTGIFDPSRGVFRIPKNTTKGVSDIALLHKGKFYAIEAKSQKGKQSPEQVDFQKRVEAAGGMYVLARRVQDVIDAGL